MKILFLGVFTEGSTNNSQRDCLRNLGHEVDEFSYRSISNFNRVLSRVKENYDILFISKGNGLSKYTIDSFKKNNNAKIAFWFMDPLSSFTGEFLEKTICSDIAFFDKKKTLEFIKKYKKENCFYICEGYDETLDIEQKVEKEYNISFIGNVYGNRKKLLERLDNVNIITSAYGSQHSIEVGKSKINLNICTDQCASDRIYKILAAGGFLLTDDWEGRELTDLVDGKDLVIYKDIDDLQTKIIHYLQDEKSRNKISKNGKEKVKELTRTNWAKKIMEKI
jgi:spore maturation protein CgeB